MNHPVFSSLLPVVLMIAAGYLAGRRRWVGPVAVKELSDLVFFLLGPSLLFRAMGNVQLDDLSLLPVAAYFLSAAIIFAATLVWYRFSRASTVLAMACTYSNTVMIGIPLIGLAYGASGMPTLLTLVSLHSLVLLTSATLAIEVAVARERGAQGEDVRHLAITLVQALRRAIIHPVPLPIIAGIAFGATGWALPEPIDKTLVLMGQAFAPLALAMTGITLSQTSVGAHLRGALLLAVAKNLLMPALVALLAWSFGVRGLPFTVMVVASALPIGANVFLFSQRYGVVEGLVTASVAVSTALALLTLPLVMLLVNG